MVGVREVKEVRSRWGDGDEKKSQIRGSLVSLGQELKVEPEGVRLVVQTKTRRLS